MQTNLRGFRPLWISGRELNPAASHFLTIIDNYVTWKKVEQMVARRSSRGHPLFSLNIQSRPTNLAQEQRIRDLVGKLEIMEVETTIKKPDMVSSRESDSDESTIGMGDLFST